MAATEGTRRALGLPTRRPEVPAGGRRDFGRFVQLPSRRVSLPARCDPYPLPCAWWNVAQYELDASESLLPSSSTALYISQSVDSQSGNWVDASSGLRFDTGGLPLIQDLPWNFELRTR